MDDKLEAEYSKLVKTIQKYDPEVDVSTLRAAFEFASVAHADVKRLSGKLMIWHPLETAIILASWNMDRDTVIAGLLHDTVEHGAATRKDILNAFGDDVLFLVEGITMTSQLKLKGSDKEYFVENLRKMFLAISKDLRIVFLRLAERIDNLKTLQFLPDEDRKNYAKESLEIYAPLAERMGMWDAKTKIDEMSFRYAYPEEYERVVRLSTPLYLNAEKRINRMKKKVLSALKKHEVEAEIYGRKKGLYSLYNKLKRKGIDWDLEKIRDIVALRVLVETVKDCYIALGVLYKLYKPVPNDPMADFIAVPKPNGYRSIHTKVYGENDNITEVQIRTYEMHQQAEYGIAAHWAYTELKNQGVKHDVLVNRGVTVDKSKLEWVRQLAQWQNEVKDSEEFLKAVKFDALSRRIFVFSPKGDVFDLPENATPVDFAYAVHTKLGLSIRGAKANGKIVPLNYKLNSGEVVEILKSKYASEPNRDWLEFVVTTVARKEIKKQLNKNALD